MLIKTETNILLYKSIDINKMLVYNSIKSIKYEKGEKEVKNWLLSIRKMENISQKEIADRCNISDAYYCMIESGKRKPSVELAKVIADNMHFSLYSKSWTNFFE